MVEARTERRRIRTAGRTREAEEDLRKERGEENAEGGDEPDVGGGVEEVVHGDGLGHGDERADSLHDKREGDTDGDEAESVAGGGGGIGLQAGGEGAMPDDG